MLFLFFKRILLQLPLFIIFISFAQASSPVPPLPLESKPSYNLSGHLEMLADPSCELNVQQVAGHKDWSGPVQKRILNLGITQSAIWLRFSLMNKANNSRKFYVSFEYPVMNSVSFYTKNQQGVFEEERTGSGVPASAHVAPDRHFLFPVSIGAGKTAVVYMRLQSSSGMTIPIRILSEQAVYKKAVRDYTVYGVLFGFLALVLVYFISVGSFANKGTSLWLALYGAFFGLHTASRAGFIRLVLPNELLAFNSLLQLLFIGGLYFTGAKFFRVFLDLKKYSKILDIIIAVFQYLSILFVAIVLFIGPGPVLTAVSFVLFAVNPVFSICLAFYFWQKGVANAGYFAIGWIIAHFVSVYDFFRINGVINYPPYSEWLIPFSLLFALAFLSVALIRQNTADHLMAGTDPLTRLANRRKFDEALYSEWNRCLRHNSPLSLIIADVDHFKKYNDALGHKAGDQLLCRIADVLKRYTQRPGELAVRYGGEEFVLLLPNLDAKKAFKLAEIIRNSVTLSAEDHKDQRFDKKITISLGIVTAIPDKEEKPENLVLEADKALYEAKRAGRNRTVVSATSAT